MSSKKNREIITSNDFYAYFKQFSIWLIKKKKLKFESLSSHSAHKYFQKFLKKWNSDELKPIFYDLDALMRKYSHLIQSNHQWNFKLSSNDSKILDKCVSEVKDLNKFSIGDEKNHKKTLNNEKEPPKKAIGPTLPSSGLKSSLISENDRILKEEEAREAEKTKEKLLKKKLKREERELSPKKIGREATIEKKKMINKMLNGEKDDDFEAENYENEERNSFAAAKRREKQFFEKKAMKLQEKRDKVNEKIQKFKESEDQKVKQLLESLGLEKKYKLN